MIGNRWVTYYTTCIHQAVLNLTDETAEHPWKLDGDVYDAAQVLEYYNSTGNRFGVFVHCAQQLMLAYLFGRHAEALEALQTGERFFLTYLCQPLHGSYFVYYAALAQLAVGSQHRHHGPDVDGRNVPHS